MQSSVSQKLDCAFGEKNWNSVKDGITACASAADDVLCFEMKSLMTHRADEAAELFCGHGTLGHSWNIRAVDGTETEL
jgi:hypothetical protein